MNEFLAKNLTNIIEQPYSPVMAPAKFFLFTKLNLPLRGTRFRSIEVIKENLRRELKSIPENTFNPPLPNPRGFPSVIRWHKCIISGGSYFEGDKIYLDE